MGIKDQFTWCVFVVFALACLSVVLLYRGRNSHPSSAPHPMRELIALIQKRHPDWKPRDVAHASSKDSIFLLHCYLLSPPYRDQDYPNWRAPALLANDPVEKINQYPFE